VDKSKYGEVKIYYVRERCLERGLKCDYIVGTVAVLRTPEGKFCRGTAVVALKDQINKRKGRDKTVGRAIKASLRRESSETFRESSDNAKRAVVRFLNYAPELGFRWLDFHMSEYDVKLTSIERRIFGMDKQEVRSA